jgi:hypothetical protein
MAVVRTLCLLSAAAFVGAQVPIPTTPDGFFKVRRNHSFFGRVDVAGSVMRLESGRAQGSAGAPVVIDVFIDLMCPDSKAAFPTLLKLTDHYGAETLRLAVHSFPLPYHRNAYLAAQGT